ncbi:MAG: DUF808 domain-containing protein [Mangrovicoccus sp.]|nr:DUF808 domain-containing protein [Mangrovicoccus sp.]
MAKGSIKNKLLFLLPAALILGALAPWLITPILMIGGLYLCFEGAEKVLESFFPHAHHAETPNTDGATLGQSEEDRRVKSAIQTDFILSAEIMAIALSVLPSSTLFEQAVTLAVVAIGITALVYGAVALIVKADDIGVYLAQNGRFGLTRGFGRGIVRAMPYLLKALKIIGTAAMLLVGGGILLHGLEHLGLHGPMHMLHEITGHIAHGGFWGWLGESSLTALVGLVVGLLVVPVVIYLIAPLAKRFRRKPAA